MKTIGIIGGGLAGLTSAILLARKGFTVTLFEKKKYPFHRVCGEYISNEVIPFLKANRLYPDELSPVPISRFSLTSPSGTRLNIPLDLGGFGVSRYSLDQWLYEVLMKEGVRVVHDRVIFSQLHANESVFETRNSGNFSFDIAIGSYGKRSTLDKNLKRSFIEQRSPYIGVKYHLKTDEVDSDIIELHNFKGGYCGISRVENEVFNLCYLSHRDNLRASGTISKMEKNVLQQNPFLKRIFSNSDFLFESPEVINEISFSSKTPVHNHILMAGDAAGMITPLCGNGMAMAIHSAKLLCELIQNNCQAGFNREKLEQSYTSVWKEHFAKRLWAGRQIQNLFGATTLSEVAVRFGKAFPPFTRKLMSLTHGKPF